MKNKMMIFTTALAFACAVPVFTGCTTDSADKVSVTESKTESETFFSDEYEETRYTHTQETSVYDIGETTGDYEDYGSSEVVESGSYTSMAEVSEYLHEYGHLPDNYITKSEAKKLGWKTNGNLSEVAPGKSIGGDSFGNREGLLPKQKGRKYFECDIDYTGGSRNAKRLIYSNDGLIYYTEDHYNSFEQIY